MTNERLHVRDFDLREFLIVNGERNMVVDAKPVVSELVTYYSLSSAAVFAEATLLDGIGLIERLPIVGEELVYVTYTLPEHRPENEHVTKHGLYLYEIRERLRSDERLEAYKIKMCSPEAMINVSSSVDKAYVNRPISSIVNESFNEFITQSSYYDRYTSITNGPILDFLNKGLVEIEPTVGEYTVVGNGESPFEFINHLCREAVSPLENNVSDYVFYEDRQGFRFRTVSSMLDRPTKKKIFMADANVSRDNRNFRSTNDDSVVAERIEIVNTVSQLNAHTDGMYRNTVAVFDPLTKRFKVTEYGYGSDMYDGNDPRFNVLGPNKTTSPDSFLENTDSSFYSLIVKNLTVPGETYHEQGYRNGRALDTHGNVLDTTTVAPSRKHEVIGLRNIKKSMMDNSLKLDITIPGNHTIDPGDVVEVFVPQVGLNVDTVTSYNFLFGNKEPRFLVLDVAQVYNAVEDRFRTYLRVAKDSFGTKPELKKQLYNELLL